MSPSSYIVQENRVVLTNMNYRFLWVEFQLNAICAELSDHGIQKALKRVPEDLNATYERILNTINMKPQSQGELARKALIWTTYTRRPLQIDELAYITAIAMDTRSYADLEFPIPTESIILDVCSNLISVDQNRVVRFVHFSVQEFLTGHHSATLSMEYEVAHREIAQMCMIFLTLFPKRFFQARLAGLRQYAIDEWPHHLLAGNLNTLPADDRMLTLTLSFFEQGPVLFTEQLECFGSMRKKKIYLKFSPGLLGLVFNLPGPQNPWEFYKREEPVYDLDLNSVVLFDNKLVIHYSIAELDSIPVTRRLWQHDYSIHYSYTVLEGVDKRVPDWLQLSTLFSVQSTEMAKYLLDNNISIEAQHLHNRLADPLQYFAQKGGWGTGVLQLLLDRVSDEDGRVKGAMQAAIQADCFDSIWLLLSKGADVNTHGGRWGNALQAAVCEGKIEVIQLLLDKGADVNAQGGQYGNALQAAAYQGTSEVIRLMLENGADINAQGGQYGSALQAAAYQGTIEIIQLLLDMGADVNAQGGMFGTVLQAAAYNGNTQVIQLLLDGGADIHARDGKYGSALEKMLALELVGTGLKVPGDIPLLVELLQDHAPTIMEHLTESEYEDIAREFLNDDRCSLDVFRGILESRGWKRMDPSTALALVRVTGHGRGDEYEDDDYDNDWEDI